MGYRLTFILHIQTNSKLIKYFLIVLFRNFIKIYKGLALLY